MEITYAREFNTPHGGAPINWYVRGVHNRRTIEAEIRYRYSITVHWISGPEFIFYKRRILKGLDVYKERISEAKKFNAIQEIVNKIGF